MKPKDPTSHPAASVWPMMSEPDLRRLAEDIKVNGLRHPIVLDEDGQVLDGRNRFAACTIAGVEPIYETYEGDDPVAYILSANNERRHLSLPERAAATALSLAQDGRRKGGRWMRGSVPEAGDNGQKTNKEGWATAMKRAGTILDFLPEKLPLIAAGKESMGDVLVQAQEIRKDKERRAELPDDLGALVDAGEVTMADALRRAVLPPDKAERVASGSLSLEEAEHLSNREEQEFRDSIDRTVSNLLTWNAVHPIAQQQKTNPQRQTVLDAMEDYDRDVFLKLEEKAWPATK